MVSTQNIFKAVLVLISAVAVTAAPPKPRAALNSVPYMPRIASAAKNDQVLRIRVAEDADPSVLAQVTCLNPSQTIVFQDENVAQLSICGGMAGSTKRCKGAPKETTGEAGSAKFTLKAIDEDATINITRKRWVKCVQAARAQCATGTLSAVCLGGASTGDVAFVLESTLVQEEL